MPSQQPGVSDAEYRVWMILCDDLGVEAASAWLDASIGRTVGEIEDAFSAWLELRLMQARGEVLLH